MLAKTNQVTTKYLQKSKGLSCFAKLAYDVLNISELARLCHDWSEFPPVLMYKELDVHFFRQIL